MQRRQLGYISFLVAALPIYIYVQYFIIRADWVTDTPNMGMAVPLLGCFAGLFILYGLATYAARKDDLTDLRIGVGAGVVFRIALIFALPNLSDDFYRFVWDGRLMNMGLDPFKELPSEFLDRIGPEAAERWCELYDWMNSKQYYSVYPPVLQTVFAGATALGKGALLESIIWMKVTIVIAEIGTMYLLDKLLRRLNLPRKALLLYALNPLVIIELTGNLHFEAFMIVFLLAAIWMLMVTRFLSASVFLTLSIGSKLLPVLIFPFLIRRLGWVRTILFGLLTAALTFGLFALFFSPETIPNFLESVRLYFKSFQFNANIQYLGGWFMGDKAYKIPQFLPPIVAGLILLGAWWEKDRIWKGLPTAILFALTLYQITAAVIHPWYLTPLIALSVLTHYRFALLWGMLIPLTYTAYYVPGIEEQMWVLWLEYILVFGFIAYEWTLRRSGLTLETWMLSKPFFRNLIRRSIPARLAIKYERIARHLDKNETVLDVGTGNGGLCHALKGNGYDVTAVDVKDISFFEEVKPVIYDGEKLPWDDNSFDTALIITVLHHTPDPEAIVKEAMRVARKKVVIMEDIYHNVFQKHLTFFTDSLVNLEFDGHPHTNKNDAGWRALFDELGMKMTFREDFRTLVFFRQVIYVLELPTTSTSSQ
ncbi:MAG: polyprenol phosphomannose-dependent alpha 1,6 mannosyltransferase MptB, partial [Bacteroidota bacterium]